jgi:glutamate racemase
MPEIPGELARDRPIGVFDSGLGGLTVVRELSRAASGEDLLYFGDTARVPYGSKSPETVRRFAHEIADFLLGKSPKMLVVACNTASAAAIESLERSVPVPVVDVIRPGAAAALARGGGPIGVIGTEGTIESRAYEKAIAALDPAREVISVACPLLVPIVEEGRGEFDPIVISVLHDYLRDLQRIRPCALILGCTHYPLIAGAISKVIGPHVPLINSGQAAAQEVQRRLAMACLNTTRTYAGRLRCFTTDHPDRFTRRAERFGGRRVDSVDFVPAEELERAPRKAVV